MLFWNLRTPTGMPCFGLQAQKGQFLLTLAVSCVLLDAYRQLKVIKYFVKISNQSLKRACFWSNIYGITINRSDLILFLCNLSGGDYNPLLVLENTAHCTTLHGGVKCVVWCAQEELVFPSEELQGGVLELLRDPKSVIFFWGEGSASLAVHNTGRRWILAVRVGLDNRETYCSNVDA